MHKMEQLRKIVNDPFLVKISQCDACFFAFMHHGSGNIGKSFEILGDFLPDNLFLLMPLVGMFPDTYQVLLSFHSISHPLRQS